jgi:cytidylate kinase
MPVITISRQLGSLGTEIAKLLAKNFQCQCLDKESLEDTFGEYGIPKENVERYDEKKPGFWDIFKTDKARYLHYLKGAIFEFANKGNCVILGRGSQIVLKDLRGVLHIRIVSSMETRIQRIMKRYECDNSHASRILQHNDNERSGFHRFFFDWNWEDVNLYDLVINTDSFSAEGAARLILDASNSAELVGRQKETNVKLMDLSLEHRVKTDIIYKEKIPVQFLEVTADRGIVTLGGIVAESDEIERCEKVATAIKEVKEIRNEIYFKPITTSYGLHY